MLVVKGFPRLALAPLNHRSVSHKRLVELQGQSCAKSELIYTINFPHGMLCLLLAKTSVFSTSPHSFGGDRLQL